MDSNARNVIKVVLGDEFDDALWLRLFEVLSSLGAVQHGVADRFVVGSQDLEGVVVSIDKENLLIESETYMGLSICGPADVVQRVHRLVQSAML